MRKEVIKNSYFHFCTTPQNYALEFVWNNRIVFFIGMCNNKFGGFYA